MHISRALHLRHGLLSPDWQGHGTHRTHALPAWMKVITVAPSLSSTDHFLPKHPSSSSKGHNHIGPASCRCQHSNPSKSHHLLRKNGKLGCQQLLGRLNITGKGSVSRCIEHRTEWVWREETAASGATPAFTAWKLYSKSKLRCWMRTLAICPKKEHWIQGALTCPVSHARMGSKHFWGYVEAYTALFIGRDDGTQMPKSTRAK